VTCCHTYRPQPIEHVRKIMYGSYTVTPGRVPIYEHSPYHPKTTKLVSQQLRRAIYLDPSVLATTTTLTPATLTNPSHNSRVPRVHPPSWATTQEMLFRATKLKEFHVLIPYPEPQLKGYVSSHNSRNTSNPTFKAPLDAL